MEYGGGVTQTTSMARFSNQSFVQVYMSWFYSTIPSQRHILARNGRGEGVSLVRIQSSTHGFLFFSVHYLQEGVHYFAKERVKPGEGHNVNFKKVRTSLWIPKLHYNIYDTEQSCTAPAFKKFDSKKNIRQSTHNYAQQHSNQQTTFITTTINNWQSIISDWHKGATENDDQNKRGDKHKPTMLFYLTIDNQRLTVSKGILLVDM